MPISYCRARKVYPGATLWVQVDAGDFQHTKVWLLAEVLVVEESPGKGPPRAEAVLMTSDRTLLWFPLIAFYERTTESPPTLAWEPINE